MGRRRLFCGRAAAPADLQPTEQSHRRRQFLRRTRSSSAWRGHAARRSLRRAACGAPRHGADRPAARHRSPAPQQRRTGHRHASRDALTRPPAARLPVLADAWIGWPDGGMCAEGALPRVRVMSEPGYAEALRIVGEGGEGGVDRVMAAACAPVPAWDPTVYLADFSRQVLLPLAAGTAAEDVAGTLAGRAFTSGQ